MEPIQCDIFKDIQSIIPDVDDVMATDVVKHLTSAQIGVRNLSQLYDVGVEDLSALPKCDAVKLIRIWKQKYSPERCQQQPITNYRVKWNQLSTVTMNKLKEGTWLPKTERCAMIRSIIKDLVTEMPDVKRAFCKNVAAVMVAKYPTALHDRNGKTTASTYLERKLKERLDEEQRAAKNKGGNEAPNIPEAYGCKHWRVAISEAERGPLTDIKEKMNETFSTVMRRNWDWTEILKGMKDTYKLQREDINSQTQKRGRRARGAPQQELAPKSTLSISQEWPFLFQAKGMCQHFLLLTEINIEEKLVTFEETYGKKEFIKFLATLSAENITIKKKYKKALKRNTCTDPHLVATIFMLIQYFGENVEQVVIEAESTLTIDEVTTEVVLPPTPCLVSVGPVFQAEKYYLAVDSNVLSAVAGFRAALQLLFSSYYVLNVQYAENAGHTLDFVQRVIAGINPEKGTKRRKRNYKTAIPDKLQTLLDKHATYLAQNIADHFQDQDQEPDINNNDDEEEVDEPAALSN